MRKRHIYFIKKPIFEFYALKSCLSLTILLDGWVDTEIFCTVELLKSHFQNQFNRTDESIIMKKNDST